MLGPFNILKCRRRWLSGTTLASLVLDSTGFWVRISARTPILQNITTGEDITGGFYPGAGFPSCHKSIYRVSEDNFRGSACVSEWILISVSKDGGLVFHNLNGYIRTIKKHIEMEKEKKNNWYRVQGFVESMWKCVDRYGIMYRNCVDIYIQDRESKYGGYSAIAIMTISN
jgi:hypothetical protein